MQTPRRTMTAVTAVAALVAGGAAAAVAAGPQDGPPRIAFLANGHVPADALAAGPIAGQLGAPIYTTAVDDLPDAAKQGLAAYGPELVIILGGPVAVDDAVVDQVEAATGLSETSNVGADGGIVRAAGSDRFATAAAVAKLLSDYDPAYLRVAGPIDADTLDGKDGSDFIATDDTIDADTLQGSTASDFIGTDDTIDADTLQGNTASDFVGSGTACTAGRVVTGTDAQGNLTCAADRVDGGDATTVDGIDSDQLVLPDTLPSGRTLKGVFDITHRGGEPNATAAYSQAFAFQVPLAQAPRPTIIEYNTTSTADCPGSPSDPQAAPGHLCIYESWAAHDGVDVTSPQTNSLGVAGELGFALQVTRNDASNLTVSRGSWAVTAP